MTMTSDSAGGATTHSTDRSTSSFSSSRLTGSPARPHRHCSTSWTGCHPPLRPPRREEGRGRLVEVLELTDPLSDQGGFSYFAGARSGMLGDDDAREAAEAMEPGTVAALIVYENTWAAPFVAAVRNSGGEMIASARIPAADVIAALDALDQTN